MSTGSVLSFKRANFSAEPEACEEQLTPAPEAPKVRVWSPQQLAAINWVDRGRGNLLITARAGSGKTTTLLGMVERMTRGYVTLAAFNVSIKNEIKDKIEAKGYGNRVQVGTMHSFGLRAWRRTAPTCKIDGMGDDQAGYYKYDRIFDIMDGLEDYGDGRYKLPEQMPFEFRIFVKRLTGLAKQHAIGTPLYPAEKFANWHDIVIQHDLDEYLEDIVTKDEDVYKLIRKGVAYAQRALQLSTALAREVIDFDDMVYMPLFTECRVFQVNWLLVDECHPPGTMVTVPVYKGPSRPDRYNLGAISDARVPIESVRVGDIVMSYVRENGVVYKRGQRVTRINSRRFDGNLVTVQTSNGNCQYTPEHKCWASFRNLRDGFFVYLMDSVDGRFRIGQCAAHIGNSPRRFGPKFRLDEQDGQRIWLLKWFPDRTQALQYEAEVSARFGIPTTLFKPGHKLTVQREVQNQQWLDRLWATIGKGDVQGCLDVHGRQLIYPFITRGAEYNNTNWLSRPHIVRACNLMTGCSMASYVGTSRTEYVDAVVTHQEYHGTVHSIDVEHDHMYIAGNLVTHNCQDLNRARRLLARKMVHPIYGRAVFVGDDRQAIYGFSGADASSFARIREEFDCQDLPLTVSYRCPVRVIDMAKQLVPDIEAAPGAKLGNTELIDMKEFVKRKLEPTDAILCRNNAPLVGMAYALIREGIPCYIQGRDIGVGLIELAGKWKVARLSALVEKLRLFREREITRLTMKQRELQAASVAERVDTLLALIGGLPTEATLEDLRTRIFSMFQDSTGTRRPMLTLSSVHKAKGREWPHVYLLGRAALMPSRYAVQPWSKLQEDNLIYVAETRAMDTLTDLMMPSSGKFDFRDYRPAPEVA